MHKINLSSMRVLQLLNLLFEKSYTMQELMTAMGDITGERCTNFLISKYINTCRFCGIDIQKVDGKYTLLKSPFGIDYSEEELNLIHDIDKLCSKMRVSKTVRSMKSLLEKLNQRSSKYYDKLSLPENDKNIENIEYAIESGYKIELTFKENDKTITAIVDPIEFTYKNLKLVLIVNHYDERKKIAYSDIENVNTSMIKISSNVSQTTVVFKLKNILAKRYTLKHGEKLVATDADGSISILNKSEDKVSLLNRLLKYGDLCEVMTPRGYRKDMKNLIDKTLENYGK